MMNVITKVVSPSFYEKKNFEVGIKKIFQVFLWNLAKKNLKKKNFAKVLANLKKNEKKIFENFFEIFQKKEFFEVFFIF